MSLESRSPATRLVPSARPAQIMSRWAMDLEGGSWMRPCTRQGVMVCFMPAPFAPGLLWG